MNEHRTHPQVDHDNPPTQWLATHLWREGPEARGRTERSAQQGYDERLAALVPCSSCGAEAGEYCISRRGNPTTAHVARRPWRKFDVIEHELTDEQRRPGDPIDPEGVPA